MGLFNKGEVTLHSGSKSNLLIDCNFLSDEDLDALADQVSRRLLDGWCDKPPILQAIPRGGDRFCAAFGRLWYGKSHSPHHVLIVDDVITSLASMRKAYESVLQDRPKGVEVRAVAVFDRAYNHARPWWVLSAWQNGFEFQ